ncbi:hypothetical protein AAES_164774 [Amazona aestiva]|uniref:Rho-GAP domain-containing protein n=1 Tax=Amazona aestiva TaxID=12930 RepID=A0A0Q3LTG0_AMAAE|nr:hypothetical protein AAES_164774 [Amazona aestiva]
MLRCSWGQGSKPHAEPLALQDLLWRIPSKLLHVQLYKEWMSALEKTSKQERLAALRKVASKLQEASLLRHLLSLLSNISRNMATSKMTAGKLAIYLAPNLLSPLQELSLDVLVQETGTEESALKSSPSAEALKSWKLAICIQPDFWSRG